MKTSRAPAHEPQSPLHPSIELATLADNQGQRALPKVEEQYFTLPSHVRSRTKENLELHLDILVVEDNIVNQRIVSRQLQKRGCTVYVANHGLEALEFLKTSALWAGNDQASAKQLSIILMDIEMPVMDGITAIQEIRKLEKAGDLISHVPVMAVTANARGEQLQAALEAGMDDSITKPYQISDIMAKMTALLLATR